MDNRKLERIHKFILEYFNDSDLTEICFFHFLEAYHDLGDGMGKRQKCSVLVKYCYDRRLVADLMIILENERPDPYRSAFLETLAFNSVHPPKIDLEKLERFLEIKRPEDNSPSEGEQLESIPSAGKSPEKPFDVPSPEVGPIGTQVVLRLGEQHDLFKDLRQRKVGGIHIVPVIPNKVETIKVFGTSTAFRKVDLTLDASGEILIQPWPNPYSQPIKTKVIHEVNDWPYSGHSWKFDRLNLAETFRLSPNRVIEFDRNIIKAAWRIRHKAAGQAGQTFLILLGESTER